jgi:hypothetical protein
MTGGRDGNLRADAFGDDFDSEVPASAAGGTAAGGLERIGGGGGSFERCGGAGGAVTLTGGFAARLLRTGGGGGVERAAPARGPAALGFLFDSPSSAMRETVSLTCLAGRKARLERAVNNRQF